MFEGNAQQMWTSLSKMKPLPPNTKVFCAHEYTQSNAKFALSIDPDNQALQKRAALINDLRKQVKFYLTIPKYLAVQYRVTCTDNDHHLHCCFLKAQLPPCCSAMLQRHYQFRVTATADHTSRHNELKLCA